MLYRQLPGGNRRISFYAFRLGFFPSRLSENPKSNGGYIVAYIGRSRRCDTAPKEISRKYVDDGIAFLRAQNVRPMSVDLDSNAVFISAEDAYELQNNALNRKDILLTRTGANFGQCAIYLEDRQAIASSHTFIIRSGNLNPFFLAVFLNTRYGKMLIDKGAYGGAQPEVAPELSLSNPRANLERPTNGD